MNIYDIHTHHYPQEAGTAIVQLTPDDFNPRPGHYYSLGIHPWDITPDWRVQMAKLFVMAQHRQVLLVGETGIDKKNGSSPIEQQIEVFREHIQLSELVRKPLVIHCVKGVDELLAFRKESQATLPWILHGFRGGIEQWKQLCRAGIWVSIGKHYNEQLIDRLPLSHLLLESDNTNDIETIYKNISTATNIDESTLRHHVSLNTDNILNLAPLPPF